MIARIHTYNTSHGFTLMELLVTIAIIGFLSSIILSNLQTARTKALASQKPQIVKQYRNALELYYSDNGNYPPVTPNSNVACLGRLTGENCPIVSNWGEPSGGQTNVYNALAPYMRTMPKGDSITYDGDASDGFGY
jgi:prepilin-type N-terminal cleavage/methylation domain-containing protein